MGFGIGENEELKQPVVGIFNSEYKPVDGGENITEPVAIHINIAMLPKSPDIAPCEYQWNIRQSAIFLIECFWKCGLK